MSRRDYRRRESKKTKKDTKKILPITILPPQPAVEVIKKGKKEQEAEEQER